MKKYFSLVILSFTLAAMSCSLDSQPTTAYSEDVFWYGAANARSGLAGCYAAMRLSGLWGGMTALMEECASPNAYNYDNREGWNSLAIGSHTSDARIFEHRWRDAYKGIGRCNLLLDKIDLNVELSRDEIEQMKAQARFLRAFYYSILANYYYTVPLITDSPNITQTTQPRSDRAGLMEFIFTELEEAAAILPSRYTSSSDYGRATRGAALALKARLLLFEASPLINHTGEEQKWRDAAEAALAVMNLGQYSLYSGSYRNLFSVQGEYSSECILDVEAIDNPADLGNSFDIVLVRYNNCAPTHNMVLSYWMKDGLPRSESAYSSSGTYDDLDPRFVQTIVYPGSTFLGETVLTDGSNTYYTIVQTGYTYKKYTVFDAGYATTNHLLENNSPINFMLLRYADVLLMYAEAKNELGELDEEVWNMTIRPIRQRAGFTESTALNFPGGGTDLLRRHIRYERKIEFACEGTYYNDIRRWKSAGEEIDNLTVTKSDNTAIITRSFDESRDYWWPVPSTQMEANPNLAPNNPNW